MLIKSTDPLQIALINGQAPAFLNSTPAPEAPNDQSFTFNGLPTPGTLSEYLERNTTTS